jgi:hypothetical protein
MRQYTIIKAEKNSLHCQIEVILESSSQLGSDELLSTGDFDFFRQQTDHISLRLEFFFSTKLLKSNLQIHQIISPNYLQVTSQRRHQRRLDFFQNIRKLI